jgi:hypothetical protein
MAVLLVRNCRRFFVIGLFGIALVPFVQAVADWPLTTVSIPKTGVPKAPQAYSGR